MRNFVGCILVLTCTFLPICNKVSLGEEPLGATGIPKFDFPAAAAKYAVQIRGSSKDCELYQIDLLEVDKPDPRNCGW